MFTRAIVLDSDDFYELVGDFASEFMDDMASDSRETGARTTENMVRGYFVGAFNRLLDEEHADEMVVFLDKRETKAMRIIDGDDFVKKILNYFYFVKLMDVVETILWLKKRGIK
jgi:hypothetical protein